MPTGEPSETPSGLSQLLDQQSSAFRTELRHFAIEEPNVNTVSGLANLAGLVQEAAYLSPDSLSSPPLVRLVARQRTRFAGSALVAVLSNPEIPLDYVANNLGYWLEPKGMQVGAKIRGKPIWTQGGLDFVGQSSDPYFDRDQLVKSPGNTVALLRHISGQASSIALSCPSSDRPPLVFVSAVANAASKEIDSAAMGITLTPAAYLKSLSSGLDGLGFSLSTKSGSS